MSQSIIDVSLNENESISSSIVDLLIQAAKRHIKLNHLLNRRKQANNFLIDLMSIYFQ